MRMHLEDIYSILLLYSVPFYSIHSPNIEQFHFSDVEVEHLRPFRKVVVMDTERDLPGGLARGEE